VAIFSQNCHFGVEVFAKLRSLALLNRFASLSSLLRKPLPLLAMKEKTTANLTEERMFIKSQLEHAKLQLEYLQNRPTVWQKLKTLFVSRTN
jgi:hypothetical protein